MSELHAMTDDQLGAAISQVGEGLAWPTTPAMAGAVGTTLREERVAPSLVAPRLSLPSRRRTVLAIVAALLALATVALAARLVIELGAAAVEVLPGRPSALPTNVVTDADLGREVTLTEAGEIVGFTPVLPDALGTPARAWVDEAEVDFETGEIARRVVTAWTPSATLPPIPQAGLGALLMQFEGDSEVAFKQVHAETNRFGTAIVQGRDAFWTTGEHQLVLVSGDEAVPLLVTGNVLIWQDAAFTFRLETALPKAQAIALAESVTPANDPG